MVLSALSSVRRPGLALAAGVVLFSAVAAARDAVDLSASQIEDELQVRIQLKLGHSNLLSGTSSNCSELPPRRVPQRS